MGNFTHSFQGVNWFFMVNPILGQCLNGQHHALVDMRNISCTVPFPSHYKNVEVTAPLSLFISVQVSGQ